MGSLMIRDLDDDVKARLRVRAATRGRSMTAEVRAILTEAVNAEPTPARRTLLDVFAQLPGTGGADLPLPERRVEPARDMGWG
ncbi:MAG: hypothetical protein FWE61_05500 [Micrococcales bacterium]|nr:hypothetical protein [Micrococcales bacterium]